MIKNVLILKVACLAYVATATAYDGNINLFDESQKRALNGSITDKIRLQSPKILLQNPSGIEGKFSVGQSGTTYTKYACPAGTAWTLFANALTMCDQNVSNPIAGLNIDATESGSDFTPRLWLFTNRSGTAGWSLITGECATMELREICQ